jgi:hypothetical protein
MVDQFLELCMNRRSILHLGVALVIVSAMVMGAFSAGDRHRTQARAATTMHRVTYGMDVNYFDNDIGLANLPRVGELMRQAGARAIRIGVPWSSIEPTAAPRYNWTLLDRIAAGARADGLQVLFEMGDEPAWDAPNGNSAAPPADCLNGGSCAIVRRYVRALVHRLARDGITYLIPRNEPQNTAKNWVGGTAAEYAAYQHAVYLAAHHADPAIRVLNGGEELLSAQLRRILRPYEIAPRYAQQSFTFVQSLYHDPRFCKSIDVLDVHVGDHGPVYSPEIVVNSEAAIRRCDGGRTLPVWVTEVGYTSIPQIQSSPALVAELGPKYQGGQLGQAKYLIDTFRALARDPQVIGINWTFLVDVAIPPDVVITPANLRRAYDIGAGLGLLDQNYHPKLSFAAYRMIAKNEQPDHG